MGTPRACKGFIESGDRTSLPLGDGGPVPSRRFRPALAASQYTYRGTQLGGVVFPVAAKPPSCPGGHCGAGVHAAVTGVRGEAACVMRNQGGPR